MPTRVFIDPGHVLHPMTIIAPCASMDTGDGLVPNGFINLIFWYVMFVQLGNIQTAKMLVRLARQPHMKPHRLAKWVRPRLHLNAGLLFKAPSILRDIFINQLSDAGSQFRESFVAILNSCSNPADIEFIYCGPDYTWACGYRFSAALQREHYPGYNLYGSILADLAWRYLHNRLQPRYGLTGLCTDQIVPKPYYKFTVLLLSDSQCKQIRRMDGAKVVPISGATFQRLATALNSLNPSAWDFRYIIINAGVSDAKRHPSTWPWSLDQMLNRALELKSMNHGPEQVLFSLAVPHPDVPQLQNHSAYAESRIRDAGFDCINWFKESHPFCSPTGHLNGVYFFGRNLFHLNHAGVTVLHNAWSRLILPLKHLSYSVSPVDYDQDE